MDKGEIGNKLSLVVSNVKKLQPGLVARHAFNTEGGIVGSNDDADWKLYSDLNDDVKPKHFEIFYIDQWFCLKDLSGETYINGSDMPLGINAEVRLQHKDEIKAGIYDICVLLTEEDWVTDDRMLEQLVVKHGNVLLDDKEQRDVEIENTAPDKPVALEIDPLKAFEEQVESTKEEISLINSSNSSLPQSASQELSEFTPQADSEFELNSSMKLKKILGFGWRKSQLPKTSSLAQSRVQNTVEMKTNTESFNMDENNLEILEQELAQTSMQDKSAEVNSHLVMGPLLSGLELQVGNGAGIEDVHKLGEELGESLKACIQGILNIHSQVENGRFGVINRNLQPIEDNPLRLGLNYTETMRTLFDNKKSMVHLSPPAAIEESLNNIRNHNQAMQEATSEALQHILMAFSPEILLKRFNSYKRTSDTDNNDPESWAWNMYQNYFSELTSNRQRGFDKLFWEIFEQSYDRRIREMQLEK
ncbi:type VI secretion system-associated FHA domain protein TagH [Vibrio algivorus]|uniref:Type VI secretion system-associated FHA domain protein TagH n=1 Tax=Vibrio algivorus TaxID=1667024 RepID=A0A557P5C5_9VIBR|nr:type VI secretion system-associated FHA domain protein TagH [Vibrio algivorus]TVO35871.1 type VI secretion system-associated FHA domain protein TagH [Vibrio algivorus]